MYPDNWVQADRAPEDGIEGVTFELPSGGFFSIERIKRQSLVQEPTDLIETDEAEELEGESSSEEDLIDAIEKSIVDEYGEVERQEFDNESLGESGRQIEFNFYYLDLLIVCRLLLVDLDRNRFAIQVQAESRSFEENEMVFAAIFQQLGIRVKADV